LLLRVQMLNERQEVIEQMAFTDVRIGEKFDLTRVKPSWPTDGWRIDKVETRPVNLAESGWSLVAPNGFRPLNAVMRRFARTGGKDTLQAIYSDGLATFSVFIEPDQSGASSSAAKSKGPINAYVRRIGDTLITVVGEVPPDTVRDVALSVKARQAR
jgi:sigma-E factor negative regulatory protein RseB